MKWINNVSTCLGLFLAVQITFAAVPVTISGPVPAIASSYNMGTSNFITYTITNNVPRASFPITVSGISSPVTRTTVLNDCGNALPAGPSTCNIGILIAPTSANAGHRINQNLSVNYHGRTPLVQNISFSVPSIPPVQYGYVADLNGNIFHCTLNPDGSFNICTATPASGAPAWFPDSITFGTINNTQYGYVADHSNNLIFYCTLNTNGTFNTCSPTPTIAPSWNPISVILGTTNGISYGYVSDTNGHVYRCTLNTNGTFNACAVTPSVGEPSWSPSDVAFATVNGTQYAYVTESNTNVYRCTLNADGTFNTCAITPSAGAPPWNPNSLAFTTVNGTQYGYVTDDGNGQIYQCTLNANGTFNTCTVASPPLPASSFVIGIAFGTINGAQYAYFADAGNSVVYQCTLNTNGTLNICTTTPASGAPPSWLPNDVALAAV